MLKRFWRDDVGAVLSAELVLVMTMLIIGAIVGLSEIQHAVIAELNDVAEATGRLNQGFSFTGFASEKTVGSNGLKSFTFGSSFTDAVDECDGNQNDLACAAPVSED